MNYRRTDEPLPPAPLTEDSSEEAHGRLLPMPPDLVVHPPPDDAPEDDEVLEGDVDEVDRADREWAEVAYAQRRLPDRTYASRSFSRTFPWSDLDAEPARFIQRVFDTDAETEVFFDGSEWLIRETPKGRYQFKVLVAGTPGNVKELWIQRVPAPGKGRKIEKYLHLRQPEAGRLIRFLRSLDSIAVEGPTTVTVDAELVEAIFSSRESLKEVYRRRPDKLRQLIIEDRQAEDVVALAHRRNQVEKFKRLLRDEQYFRREADSLPGAGTEKVWRKFFEDNPWILGISLTGQLLTSWSEEKLEQVVSGFRIGSIGKRTDALLRTSGRVRSMVFAEFKTHRADLLGDEYRSGCWAPSEHLAGGVAQLQGTVHRAVTDIGERLADLADDVSEIPGQYTYLIKPRSFLVIGQLTQLTGSAGGDHQDRILSFELYRRSLLEPEVVTFDELLARAEWLVSPTLAE